MTDQNGGKVVELLMGAASCCVSAADAARNWGGILARLSENNITLVTSKSQTQAKEIIEKAEPEGDCVVAARPGYVVPDIYVHADGTVAKTTEDSREVIVTFEPDSHYSQSGSHEAWLAGVAPFLAADARLRVATCFALAALLIAKTNKIPTNPMLEVYGPTEVGKTTLGILAGSTFGGSSSGTLGIGRSANTTANAFREMLAAHNDAFLFLDETNVTDAEARANLSILFEAGSGTDRARHGDSGRKELARASVFYTGNNMLADNAPVSSAILAAAQTRMVSLNLDPPLFHTVPAGYASRAEALEGAHDFARAHYGTASRGFVQRIVEECHRDEQKFRARLNSLMLRFINKARALGDTSDRIVRANALIYAAGKLAIDYDVLPHAKVMSDVLAVLRAVTRDQRRQGLSSELRQVVAALEANRHEILGLIPGSLERRDALSAASAWKRKKEGSWEIYLRPTTAVQWFGNRSRELMAALKKQGVLIGENTAKSKKHTIHAPSFLPVSERVHKLIIPKGIICMAEKKKSGKNNSLKKSNKKQTEKAPRRKTG